MWAPYFKICLLVVCVASASVNQPRINGRINGRIVGGNTVNITQAPWQVSLQVNGFHMCGGSIISPTWILSAAHCSSFRGTARVRLGSSFHNKGGELIEVKHVIRDSRFNGSTVDYDFALFELERPIEFGAAKQPIKLQNFDEYYADDTICIVTGWGNTQNSSENRMHLRGVQAPIVHQKKCSDAYVQHGEITPRMICAGVYTEGGKDACQGDSGGPLVAFNEDDQQPRLIGIVSWGYGCAKPHFPGIYSRVLAARDWIFSITGI